LPYAYISLVVSRTCLISRIASVLHFWLRKEDLGRGFQLFTHEQICKRSEEILAVALTRSALICSSFQWTDSFAFHFEMEHPADPIPGYLPCFARHQTHSQDRGTYSGASTALFNAAWHQLRKWKVGALPLDRGTLQKFTACRNLSKLNNEHKRNVPS